MPGRDASALPDRTCTAVTMVLSDGLQCIDYAGGGLV